MFCTNTSWWGGEEQFAICKFRHLEISLPLPSGLHFRRSGRNGIGMASQPNSRHSCNQRPILVALSAHLTAAHNKGQSCLTTFLLGSFVLACCPMVAQSSTRFSFEPLFRIRETEGLSQDDKICDIVFGVFPLESLCCVLRSST